MVTENNKGSVKDNILSNVPDGGFLQSAHWEDFQQSLGRKVIRIENQAASALLIEHRLPLVGSYFFVPRGPILKITNNKLQDTNKARIPNSKISGFSGSGKAGQFSIFNQFINELITQAMNENVRWIRVEPQNDEDLKLIKEALKGKYPIKKSYKNHEPAQTIMLDLKKSEEEILAGMKSKTRYNIRLAKKKGVDIVESRDPKDFRIFSDLVETTSKRDKVASHPASYYIKMIETIGDSALKLYLAKYKNKTIAGVLISFSGKVATYLHGASSDEHRNVMAPHLLQWEAMKKAKKLGCEKYDLGGVKIVENKSGRYLRWEGITRFKLGFCPDCQPVIFPGCWDIVLDKYKYRLYRFLQKIKG